MTPLEVLDLPMDPNGNEAGASSIRGYLVELLRVVWIEQEGFSGKRPFGNSGWASELYKPLIAAGVVPGALNEDGCIDEVDEPAADAVIVDAISAMLAPSTQGDLLAAAVAAEEEAKIFSRRADRLRQEADSYRLCAEARKRATR